MSDERGASVHRPSSALVVKPSSLGDIVHTLPALHRLRLAWPDCRFEWLANSEWLPLLEGNADLDGVVEFPRGRFRGVAGALRWWNWSGRLRKGEWGMALDFQGLLRSALMCRMAGGSRVAGLSDAREGAGWFYRWTATVDGSMHSVDRYLALADLLVRATGREPATETVFPLPGGSPPDGYIPPPTPCVILHPHSRGRGKSLPDASVARLCARLRDWAEVVLVGCADAVGDPPPGTHDLRNRTSLPELVWLLRHCNLAISVDSGPMHLAAAAAPRTLGIHTWSSPAKVGPYGATAWVWKGGTIARRNDLPADAATQSRPPPPRDLERIADWAREMAGKPAE